MLGGLRCGPWRKGGWGRLTSGVNESDGALRKRARRRFTDEEKLRIVEQALAPGASVAAVALAHRVNANLVFRWRKLYREGRLAPVDGPAALLPVRLDEPAAVEHHGTEQAAAAPVEPVEVAGSGEPAAGVIHIQLRKARVRIEGRADAAALRAVLEALGG